MSRKMYAVVFSGVFIISMLLSPLGASAAYPGGLPEALSAQAVTKSE